MLKSDSTSAGSWWRTSLGTVAAGVTSHLRLHCIGSLRTSVAWLLPVALVILGQAAQAAPPPSEHCGPIKAGYGPWDYRKHRGEQLRLVESAHFPAHVEALIRGNRGTVGADIDYTLRAFPNHHRALVAMARFAERTKQDPPRHMNFTVECWFERAIRFAGDDPVVRMLYAQYLQGKVRVDEALFQLNLATQLAGDNPITHYNAGLVFLELKRYDKALEQAHIAAKLGMPRQELRQALMAVGQWREPLDSSVDEAANSSRAKPAD